MLNTSNQALIVALKQMIIYCKDIQKLLKNDRNYFSKDEISAIEQSNQSKATLLEHLSSLLNELSSHTLKNKSGNFLEAIEKVAAELDVTSKIELTNMIDELKAELAGCYECLMINSKVVYTNIQQLKTLWDKLLSCRSEINIVYDSKGSKI